MYKGFERAHNDYLIILNHCAILQHYSIASAQSNHGKHYYIMEYNQYLSIAPHSPDQHRNPPHKSSYYFTQPFKFFNQSRLPGLAFSLNLMPTMKCLSCTLSSVALSMAPPPMTTTTTGANDRSRHQLCCGFHWNIQKHIFAIPKAPWNRTVIDMVRGHCVHVRPQTYTASWNRGY